MKRALYALRIAQHPLCMAGESRAWFYVHYQSALALTGAGKAKLRLMTWGRP